MASELIEDPFHGYLQPLPSTYKQSSCELITETSVATILFRLL
jgi:hypothetical protein